jgi:hypothetical protein
MANDTFDGIAHKVLLRCPSAPLTLARDWVQSAFRDIVERRRWSWSLKTGQLYTYPEVTDGTATTVVGSDLVTITGAVVDAAHIGRQFRIGSTSIIPTIIDVDLVGNTYTISMEWRPVAHTNAAYSIYQAYVSLPEDFHTLVSVIDPLTSLPMDVQQSTAWIDGQDPQRVVGAAPQVLAFRDYYDGRPRYELWPHQRSALVFPTLFGSRPIDPFDAGATVPHLLPSDVILERALMYCAAWPGPSMENPNPYFANKANLAEFHRSEYERRMLILEKQDNEHMQQDVWYQSEQGRSRASLSGRWMQSHGPDAY